MFDVDSPVTQVAIIAGLALVSAPLLGELVVVPAFNLGWNAAALCNQIVSNGFGSGFGF